MTTIIIVTAGGNEKILTQHSTPSDVYAVAMVVSSSPDHMYVQSAFDIQNKIEGDNTLAGNQSGVFNLTAVCSYINSGTHFLDGASSQVLVVHLFVSFLIADFSWFY